MNAASNRRRSMGEAGPPRGRAAPARWTGSHRRRVGGWAVLFVLSVLASDAWHHRMVPPRAASADGPVNLSRSDAASSNPALAVSAVRWMAAWEEGDAVWYALRSDAAWSTPAAVPAAAGAEPALAAAPDGGFELVWSSFNEVDETFEILHSRFGSSSWSLPERVAETAGDSIAPAIAVASDGTRLVAWVEAASGATTLYVARAAPGGDWEHGPLLDTAGTEPTVAYGGGGWHLAWAEDVDADGRNDVLYRRGGAAAWSTSEIVAMAGSAAGGPSLAVDGSGVPAIAWLAGGAGVSFSLRTGGAWSTPVGVGPAGMHVGAPSLTRDGARLGLAWASGTDVRLARYDDGAWADPEAAMSLAARARGAVLAAADGRLGLAAEGRGGEAEGDVFFVELASAQPRATPSPTTSSPTAPSSGTPAAATPTGATSPAAVDRIFLPYATRP